MEIEIYFKEIENNINAITHGTYKMTRKVYEYLESVDYGQKGTPSLHTLYMDGLIPENILRLIEDYISAGDWEYIYPEAYDTQPSNQPETGYIYLIKLENGLYKIGKSKHLAQRMEVFAVSFPMKWELYYSFQSTDYTMAEKALHAWFSKKREIGEWFRLNDRDVKSITMIKDWEL